MQLSFCSSPSNYSWSSFLGEERQFYSQSQLHARNIAAAGGSWWRWAWFVKWAIARAGRELHPSSWSQQSHENSSYDILLPWPCSKQSGGSEVSRWRCQPCTVHPAGCGCCCQHPPLSQDTSQSRIWPEQCLLEKPPFLFSFPVLS